LFGPLIFKTFLFPFLERQLKFSIGGKNIFSKFSYWQLPHQSKIHKTPPHNMNQSSTTNPSTIQFNSTDTKISTLYVVISTHCDKKTIKKKFEKVSLNVTGHGTFSLHFLEFDLSIINALRSTALPEGVILYITDKAKQDDKNDEIGRITVAIEIAYAMTENWQIYDHNNIPSFICRESNKLQVPDFGKAIFALNGIRLSNVHLTLFHTLIGNANGILKSRENGLVVDWILSLKSPSGKFANRVSVIEESSILIDSQNPKSSNYVEIHTFIKTLVKYGRRFEDDDDDDEDGGKKKHSISIDTTAIPKSEQLMSSSWNELLAKTHEDEAKKTKDHSSLSISTKSDLETIVENSKGFFKFTSNDLVKALDSRQSGNPFRRNPCCIPLLEKSSNPGLDLLDSIFNSTAMEKKYRFIVGKIPEEARKNNQSGGKRKASSMKSGKKQCLDKYDVKGNGVTDEELVEDFVESPTIENFQVVFENFLLNAVTDSSIWEKYVFMCSMDDRKLIVLYYSILNYEKDIFAEHVSQSSRIEFANTLCEIVSLGLRMTYKEEIIGWSKQVLIMLTRVLDLETAVDIIFSKVGILYQPNILGGLFSTELGYEFTGKFTNRNTWYLVERKWDWKFLTLFWRRATFAVWHTELLSLPTSSSSQDPSLKDLQSIALKTARLNQAHWDKYTKDRASFGDRVVDVWKMLVILSAIIALEKSSCDGNVDWLADFWKSMDEIENSTQFTIEASQYFVITIMNQYKMHKAKADFQEEKKKQWKAVYGREKTEGLSIVSSSKDDTKDNDDEDEEDDFFSKTKKKTTATTTTTIKPL
jgi:hypothetical protein